MTIRFALPTGDPRAHVGELLARAGITASGYEPASRVLRSVDEDEGLTLRVFREKDIPIQVAMGNYDLGVCNDLWLAEMQVRFPLQRIVRVGSLPGLGGEVWLAGSATAGFVPGELPGGAGVPPLRLASEFPNLADAVAVHLRLPRYTLLSLYGSAEAYPPEDADLLLLPASGAADLQQRGLVPLARVFSGGLALIANADALARRPLGALLGRLGPLLTGEQPTLDFPRPGRTVPHAGTRRTDVVRLALPDGHAQRQTPGLLALAGLRFDGYDESSFVRRPVSPLPGLEAKVVRPQDMPQLVALGLFDVAISGRDLLHEHLCKFPDSPVAMAVDLERNRYRIGPVVEAGFPAESTAAALPIWKRLGRPVRIASEFPATAERFARDNHLHYTSIIPVAGASEGFVPEDADLLVEGTETGSSIRANGLKMLDPFMESTSCVIVRTRPATDRQDLLQSLVERFRRAVAGAAVP